MSDQSAGSHCAPSYVVVSPEMVIARGRGPLTPPTVPKDAVGVAFDIGAASPNLSVAGAERIGDLLAPVEAQARVVVLLSPSVIRRIGGGWIPGAEDTQAFHLPSALRGIALALRDCERSGEAGEIYMAAKAIEIVYETWALLDDDVLIPMAARSDLSQADSEKIVAARRLIEARWHEKLSLNQVAAQCGLNREKLTRGFRQMFSCSVAEALAEQRLTEASRMLLTTDLPVSSVGYENGYVNNASFARAFGRRFGLSPSDFRARRLSAQGAA